MGWWLQYSPGMAMRFDLITIDVVEPRQTAAGLIASEPHFSIELDEDDGRWLVVAEAHGRRFGLQRSDRREVDARVGSIEDVGDGCVSLSVTAVHTSERFFCDAMGLAVDVQSGPDRRLTLDGVPVIQLVEAAPVASNVHLDFVCGTEEFATEADRLLDLGATRMGPLRSAEWGTSQIFTAPGGGVFCLNAYGN